MKKFMSTKMKIFLLVLFILTIACYSFAAIDLFYSNYPLESYLSNNHDWHIGWGTHENDLSGTMKKDFPDTVKNININTNSSDISLSTHDDATIDMDVHGYFDSNHEYSDCIKRFDIDNQDIDIETNNNNNFFDDISLNISIPNNFNGNINIQTHSGKVSLTSLSLSNLSVSTNSGDIQAYNLNVATSKIKVTSGEIKYTGSLGECNVDSTSGDIKLNLSDLGNNSNINSTSGEINVNLASSIGYKANLSSTSGEIEARNVDGKDRHMNKDYNFTNGDGSKNISLHTTSGDISIY